MKKRIIMITGDLNSGKTRLMYAICSILDLEGFSIGGMIQVPTLPGEAKTTYSLSDQLTGISNTILDEESKEDAQKIGKYYIHQDSFDWANTQIRKAFSTANYLIFDEIGMLEIEQGGFYPSFIDALNTYKGTIIMIVRTPFVEEVYSAFSLNRNEVLSLSSTLSSNEAYNEVLNNE